MLAWPFKQEVGDIGTNRYLPLDPADDLEVYSVNEVDGLAVLFRAQREGQERVWATSKIRRLLKHETLN